MLAHTPTQCIDNANICSTTTVILKDDTYILQFVLTLPSTNRDRTSSSFLRLLFVILIRRAEYQFEDGSSYKD